MYGNQTSHTPYTQAFDAQKAQDASQPAPSPQDAQEASQAPYQAQNGTQAPAPSQESQARQKATQVASTCDASYQTSYLASSKAERDTARQIRLLLGGA